MLKNLTSSQLLLIGIAAVLLLLAGFSFFLLQNPAALLPFAPSKAGTPTPSATAQASQTSPTETPVPTRQTSYTPFATLLTPQSTAPGTIIPATIAPTSATTVSPGSQTPSGTVPPGSVTPPQTSAAPSPTGGLLTSTPSLIGTLLPGEYGVTGRMLLNGTPAANVVVEFKDDIDPRQASTNLTGHYWFTSRAPGTSFTLTFKHSINPNLVPAVEVSSLAVVNGNLPTGINIIDLPDFEVSLNLHGALFETLSPMDGAAYSASVIGPNNKIPFAWTLYFLGGSYHVELGPTGSDQPIWRSDQLVSTYAMWDGTLNDGTHISQGTYWWRVAVTKSLGNYVVDLYTPPWDITFNP